MSKNVGDTPAKVAMDQDLKQWNTVRKGRQRRQNSPHCLTGIQESSNEHWSGAPLCIEYIPPVSTNVSFQPSMLLLTGLPGSGKSTFARSLVDAMPYKYARVNQDELKSRKKCLESAKKAMSHGLCVIVDRCNFDTQQRSVWYDLATQYKYPVDCLVLNVPVSLCIERCQQRTNHETVIPQEASRIVNMMKKQWMMPTRQEQTQSLRTVKVIGSSPEFNEALVWYLRLN